MLCLSENSEHTTCQKIMKTVSSSIKYIHLSVDMITGYFQGTRNFLGENRHRTYVKLRRKCNFIKQVRQQTVNLRISNVSALSRITMRDKKL